MWLYSVHVQLGAYPKMCQRIDTKCQVDHVVLSIEEFLASYNAGIVDQHRYITYRLFHLVEGEREREG